MSGEAMTQRQVSGWTELLGILDRTEPKAQREIIIGWMRARGGTGDHDVLVIALAAQAEVCARSIERMRAHVSITRDDPRWGHLVERHGAGSVARFAGSRFDGGHE